MQNLRIKPALYLLLSISVGLFFLICKIQQPDKITIVNILRITPKVISLDLLLFGLFISFFWKFWIFKSWLVPFPNLSGTWKGIIQSTWTDPITNLRPKPIPAILTIEQSFLKINCVMRTAEMTSYSTLADFIIDPKNQIKRLYYSYESIPIQTVTERSPQHYGTIVFDISGQSNLQLIGDYWTGRKTTGHIEMEFWGKCKLDRYPETLGAHPVSEERANKS